jgi:hypothetical protein
MLILFAILKSLKYFFSLKIKYYRSKIIEIINWEVHVKKRPGNAEIVTRWSMTSRKLGVHRIFETASVCGSGSGVLICEITMRSGDSITTDLLKIIALFFILHK